MEIKFFMIGCEIKTRRVNLHIKILEKISASLAWIEKLSNT